MFPDMFSADWLSKITRFTMSFSILCCFLCKLSSNVMLSFYTFMHF